MNVVLCKADESDLPIVKNLVHYYVYDMSEHMGWPCRPDGVYSGCDNIESFWNEEGKHAFILRHEDELVGFAMVRGNHEEDEIDYSIAEFFVLRKFRGKGVGEKVARQLFDRFSGQWMVAQLVDNRPAIAFWRKVISRYTQRPLSEYNAKSRWGPMNQIRFTSLGQPTTE